MLTGVAIGLSIGVAGHLIAMNSYKNILIMKAKDGSAEHISGKFYYIVEESEDNVKRN